MDQVLKLVNGGSTDVLLNDNEKLEKIKILSFMDLVEICEKQVVLTEKGKLALKIGFREYKKMKKRKDYSKSQPVSDRAILYFLKNWNRKRIIGISTWILLLFLWAVLRLK